MKKKKVLKAIIFTVLAIAILFVVLIFYIAIKQLEEEKVLKQELMYYSNLDLIKDKFPLEIKTTGDCAYIEEAIKKYYRRLSDNMKGLNDYLNNHNLTNVLTIDSLISDRPDFTISRTTVKDTKSKINTYLQNIASLCDEETIKNLIDKEKLDDSDYYYDLYLQLMCTDHDLKEFADLKARMKEASKYLSEVLDKVDEILLFLQAHDSEISYQNHMINFNSTTLATEYKKLIAELSIYSNQGTSNDKLDNKGDVL